MKRAIFVALLFAIVAQAQIPDLRPGQPNYNPPTPTIVFTLDWPTAASHYAIAVDSTGQAAFRDDTGSGNTDDSSSKGPADPIITKFRMSSGNIERIFKAATKLNYFQTKVDSSRPGIANTGTKTLIYADPNRHFSTTYNYTQDPDAQQLTSLFQGVAETLAMGAKLEHDCRFDKLGLTADLRALSEAQKSGRVAELAAIAPVLQKIANDSGVMNIARQEAKKLLEKGKS